MLLHFMLFYCPEFLQLQTGITWHKNKILLKIIKLIGDCMFRSSISWAGCFIHCPIGHSSCV